MLISDITRRAAHRHGDAPALVSGDRTMSFAEYDRATSRLGLALLARGLRPGDRVTMLMPNTLDFFVASTALARAGLVQVPLNERETADDHRHRIVDADARAMIGDGSCAEGVELVIELDEMVALSQDGPEGDCDVAVGEGDPFRLAYTGGTTGPPKAVVGTPRQKSAELAHLLLDFMPDVAAGDVLLHAGPVTHASGSFFLPSFMRGACNVVLPRFRPGEFLEALERTRAAYTFLVPTMIAMLLDEPNVGDVDLQALKAIFWGGSPLPAPVAERARQALGPRLRGTYGQAEAPMALTYLREDQHDRVGSAGRPYSLVEVRVADAEGRSVPPGETGEVLARGDIVMTGYWNRPEETERTLAGGWLHTGDVGHFDDDGFLHLSDRVNDVIISGGFNVYPSEVESAILAHPAVREAAVVGVLDDTWGESVQAVVSLRAEATEAELTEHLRGQLAGFKRPRNVVVWDEIPKSGVGKILRRAVRDRLRAEAEG